MKQNRPRVIPSSQTDYDDDFVGIVAAAGACSFLAGALFTILNAIAGEPSSGPLIPLGGGVVILAMIAYPFYRTFLAPHLYNGDATIVNKSYQLVKDAQRLARDPHLKSDPTAREAVKVLWEDHQRLLQLGAAHRKAVEQGLSGCHAKFLELRNDMTSTYHALQALRDEKELLAESTKPTSRTILRNLKEETRSIQQTRDLLN